VPSRARPSAGGDLRREQARHRLPDPESRDELNATTWVVGKDYTAARPARPVTCPPRRSSGDARRRRADSWTLRPVLSKKQDGWEKKRADMKQVCTSCHGGAFINSFYKSYDDTIDLWNTKFAQPAQNVMTALREAGKLTPTPFDEEIEWTFYRLWTRGAAGPDGRAMQGPDFVQWHGFFEVAENFYMKFLPQAKEAAHGDEKVLAALKAVDDDPGTPGGRALARGAEEDRRVLQGALREVMPPLSRLSAFPHLPGRHGREVLTRRRYRPTAVTVEAVRSKTRKIMAAGRSSPDPRPRACWGFDSLPAQVRPVLAVQILQNRSRLVDHDPCMPARNQDIIDPDDGSFITAKQVFAGARAISRVPI